MPAVLAAMIKLRQENVNILQHLHSYCRPGASTSQIQTTFPITWISYRDHRLPVLWRQLTLPVGCRRSVTSRCIITSNFLAIGQCIVKWQFMAIFKMLEIWQFLHF